MNKIISLLGCPECHNHLELRDEVENTVGIGKGKLLCKKCKKDFPIKDGVFYLDSNIGPKGNRIEKGDCKLEEFKKLYLNDGFHKSHVEYLEKKLNLPKDIAARLGEYENARVKGRLLEWLSPSDGDVIVDLGCGVGYFIFDIIKTYPDKELSIAGVDALPICLKNLSQRKYTEGKRNILPLVGNVKSLPFKDSSVDIIVSSEMLEHVSNPQKAISEMSRVLKTNGKLMISTPNRRALEFWKSLSDIKSKLGFPQAKLNYAEEPYDEPLYWKTLKFYVESAGFTIKRCEFNVVPIMRRILMKVPNNIAYMLVALLEPMLKGERWGSFTLAEFKK